MTKKHILFFIILLFSLFSLTYFIAFFQPGKLAHGVNRKNILSLCPGMNEQQVIEIIGKPLKIIDHYYYKKFPGHAEKTMLYGIPNIYGGGLEINVNFLNGKVLNILIENYDLGVYWFDPKGQVMWRKEIFNKFIKQ